MTTPRAHLVQMDIVWEDPDANYALVDEMLSGVDVERGDLVVLPELFDTGFSLNVDRTADTDGRTLGYIKRLASRFGATVHGGRTVLADDGQMGLNRAEVVSASGDVIASYDKIHPFSYGREPERFAAGARVVTCRWARGRGGDTGGDSEGEARGGAVLCPAVCYDLRFPELFRAGLDMGAEVFALGANWPAARADHWRALCIARAIENQAFVLGVNRVGNDPKLAYAGGTIAVDPRGRVLGELGDEAGVLSVGVDLAELRAWRDEFPAWRDRSAALRSAGIA
jgi:predicted amidohydrolase